MTPIDTNYLIINDLSGIASANHTDSMAFHVYTAYIPCMAIKRRQPARGMVLQPGEREFLAALERVAYGNPFNDKRARLIRELAPDATEAELVDQAMLARRVAPRLQPLAQPAVLDRLGGTDRRLVEAGLLYVCYHHHVELIDELIDHQAVHDEARPAGQVADTVIGELGGYGFAEAEATRYFALFYQLRRAFRFIVLSLAGQCDSMRRLRRALWDNAFTHDMRGYEAGLWDRMEDFSTLLVGETGTGNGAAAAAIGRSEFIPYGAKTRRFAANFAASFVSINLSQFPETLIESELFGHRKGAFTGAVEHHEGLFARCSAHGALFLDEIGEVSIPVQIKLLQVLQDRSFTPLGSHERKRFAGRVIAATNQPLDKLRATGQFRDDFYYRLCSDIIRVPTLRERIEERSQELEDLVRLIVARIAGEDSARFSDLVMESIARDLPRDYPWPGNVRELEQAVRRILLTGHYAGDVKSPATSEDEQLAISMQAGRLTADQLLGGYCAALYRRLGTYAEVAARTGLDRRTARKYIVEHAARKHSTPPLGP
jgi:hypothetical protein